MKTKNKITIITIIVMSLTVKGQEKIITENGAKSDFIYKNGNIGIGITNPNAKLEVNGNATFRGDFIVKNSYGNMGLIEIKDLSTVFKSMAGITTLTTLELDVNKAKFNIPLEAKNATFVGVVGIGTLDTKGFELGVNGKIAAEEVKVALYNNWSDFVFKKDYNLPTLKEVENHIKEKGHLKDIPSAIEVEENGIFLGEMDSKLLQKIEELTLYTIQQEKKIQKLEEENKKLKSLSNRLTEIEKLLESKK